MELALAALILLALAWFVTAPLWRAPSEGGVGARRQSDEDPRLADLEARKEAKYREIRDAELDHAQGKLSDADWRRADAQLRQEAIEILKEMDEARAALRRPAAPRA